MSVKYRGLQLNNLQREKNVRMKSKNMSKLFGFATIVSSFFSLLIYFVSLIELNILYCYRHVMRIK